MEWSDGWSCDLQREEDTTRWQEARNRYPLGRDRKSKIYSFVEDLEFQNFDH
jgi:hypothetical protein